MKKILSLLIVCVASTPVYAQTFDLGQQQIDLQFYLRSQMQMRDIRFDSDVQRRFAQQQIDDVSRRVREQSQIARLKAKELKAQVDRAQFVPAAPLIEPARADYLNRQAPTVQINISDAQARMATAQANLDESRRQARQNMKEMNHRMKTQRQVQLDFFRSMR